jgi:hypothetical protein
VLRDRQSEPAASRFKTRSGRSRPRRYACPGSGGWHPGRAPKLGLPSLGWEHRLYDVSQDLDRATERVLRIFPVSLRGRCQAGHGPAPFENRHRLSCPFASARIARHFTLSSKARIDRMWTTLDGQLRDRQPDPSRRLGPATISTVGAPTPASHSASSRHCRYSRHAAM